MFAGIGNTFTKSEFGEILVKRENSHATLGLSDKNLRIIEYLKVHGCIEESEIAEGLHLNILDVLVALYDLLDKGVVRRIPDESSPDSNGG